MRESQQLAAKYAMLLQERKKHADQSVEEFCRGRGISPWTYYSWKKRLRQASNDSTVPKKFLPVQFISPTPTTTRAEGGTEYEIKFPNGITMRLMGALQGEDHSAIIGAIAGVRP
jgi:hypothetical protein